MSTDTLLVELGTEELPPKALKSLGLAFRDGIVEGLKQRELGYGVFIVINRLTASHEFSRSLGSHPPIVDSREVLTGLSVVARDQLRLRLRHLRKNRQDRRRDASVDIATMARQQTLIGRIADKGVAEDDLLLSRRSSLEDQLRSE